MQTLERVVELFALVLSTELAMSDEAKVDKLSAIITQAGHGLAPRIFNVNIGRNIIWPIVRKDNDVFASVNRMASRFVTFLSLEGLYEPVVNAMINGVNPNTALALNDRISDADMNAKLATPGSIETQLRAEPVLFFIFAAYFYYELAVNFMQESRTNGA